MTEMSCSPDSDMCSVRGIGVMDSASTCTSRRSERRNSFCATPNRCSSSSTTSPRFFGIVSGEDAVRPDQHLDPPLPELVQDPRLVLARVREGHHLDPDREVAVALPKRVPVLLGEDRGRAEEERLLPVERRREGGPHGNLRLAEADVAADEPVHRPRRLQVLLHGLDRLQLVVGLAMRKDAFECSSHSPERSSANPGAYAASARRGQGAPPASSRTDARARF